MGASEVAPKSNTHRLSVLDLSLLCLILFLLLPVLSSEAEGNESEVSVEYLPAAKPGLPVSVEYLPAAKPGLPVSCSAVPHQGNPGSQSPSQPYYHGDVNVSRHEGR